MSMLEVRHRAPEALQKPSMHETAGHESRLWIFDPVSGGGVAETFDARNRGARVQAMDI
jgi:hypothetical protein